MKIKIGTINMVIFCATISYFSGIVTHFAAILPTAVKYAFYGLSLLSGWIAIIAGTVSCSDKKIHNYSNTWILFILWLLFVGAYKSNFYTAGFDVNIFLAQDVRFVTYIALGIVLADKIFWDGYVKIIYWIAGISIIMGIIALTRYNFSYAGAVEGERLGLWDLPYFLWWTSGSVFAFVYPYTKIMGENKLIGYGAFFTYAVLGLLFIKRSSIINVLVCIVMAEIVSPNKEGKRKYTLTKILFLIGTLLLVAYLIPYSRALLNAMIGRFNSQGGLFEYDRAREAQGYFKTIGFFTTVFGQGLGHYIRTTRLLNALHTGLYNLIYKGGIVFILIYLYFVIELIKKFIKQKHLCNIDKVCLCVAVSYFISMFYEASWSYTVFMLQYVTPIVVLLTGSLSHTDNTNEIEEPV